MKYLFVPVTLDGSFKINSNFSKFLKILPKNIGLISTLPFLNLAQELKHYLKNKGKKVIIHGDGQILGCNIKNAEAIQNEVEAFIYVGSGKFHPLMLALSLKKPKPIFIYNPITQEFSRLKGKEIEKAAARKKTAKIKFLWAKNFGILVSTKRGQQKLEKAIMLKEKIEKQGKNAFIFLFNNFDQEQLENFTSIECWINTACPGLSLENPFLWIDEVDQIS